MTAVAVVAGVAMVLAALVALAFAAMTINRQPSTVNRQYQHDVSAQEIKLLVIVAAFAVVVGAPGVLALMWAAS